VEVAWPADEVERWPIDRLIPYAKNSRTHSEAQIAQLAASMKEWGWTNPALADETGGVIAGHARILAARLLGIADVPASAWSAPEVSTGTAYSTILFDELSMPRHMMASEVLPI